METITDTGTTTLSIVLSAETVAELEAEARATGRPAAVLASRAIEEYLRSARFPGIRFVNTAAGERKAVVEDGHSVWGIVFNARGLGMDPERTAKHLGIDSSAVRLALDYYAAYPEETDDRLAYMAEFARDPKAFCPQVRIIDVSLDDEAAP